MVIDEFIDPVTKKKLRRDSKGNLFLSENDKKHFYLSVDGVYDFVPDIGRHHERVFYDKKYSASGYAPLSLKACRNRWYDETFPESLVLLKSLDNISGKKILLLGNGTSIKEFHFLELGAKVVYTDLSVEAVKYMKNLFYASEFIELGLNNIEFHAVNALKLPYPDESFDVIYGFAFVHHIQENDIFFSEVKRCLKQNGICRFLDEAYSPIWQSLKRSVLKPLQIYSHKKTGISPEDLQATQKGGFTKEEIKKIMDEFQFREYVFERVSFFQHLWTRGVDKLLNGNGFLMGIGIPIMRKLDLVLTERTSFMKDNLLRLIWGFDK